MRTTSWIVTTGLTVLMLLWMVQGQSMDQLIMMSQASSSDAEEFPDKDTVRLELDMLFSAEDYELMYKLDHENDTEDGNLSRKKRKAMRYEQSRWTNNEIPYIITGSFSSKHRAEVQAAVNDWNRYTCVRFRPLRSGDRNYISIQNGGGCSSYVGMSMGGGEQPLRLAPGCRVKSIILHEMGHALGFFHEQTRPDRDQYVRIYLQNVNHGMEHNFQKHSASMIVDHGVPYDYTSIMHYGKTAFSNNGRVTISTIDPSYQNVIGTKKDLSFKDVKLANLIYKCGEHCGKKSCPGDGFVGKDCKCYCPGSPMKECGTGGGGGDDKGDETGGKGGGTDGNGGTDDKDKGGNGNNNCGDAHPNCAKWAAEGECSQNPGWMHSNCKKSCNKCSGGNTGGQGGGNRNCKDNHSNCPTWAGVGGCIGQGSAPRMEWMLVHCKLSCKKCSGGNGGGTTTPGGQGGGNRNCKDNHSSCPRHAAVGRCRGQGPGPSMAWMLVHCKLSCNKCSGGNGGGTTTPGGQGGGNRNCKDNHSNCPSWAAVGGCRGQGSAPRMEWMLVHCKLSCKKCSGGGGSSNTPSCVDQKQNCGYWAQIGHCRNQAYASFMRDNCAASCNLCSSAHNSPVPACADKHRSCSYWASIGQCYRNYSYMVTTCKKSCRQC